MGVVFAPNVGNMQEWLRCASAAGGEDEREGWAAQQEDERDTTAPYFREVPYPMDRSIAFALLSMVFAGVTAVLAKAGLRNVSGDVALLVRTCLIFGLVWGNAFAFRQLKELALLTTRDALFLCLSGATTFFSWLFYYRAMKEGSVSVVATIDKASIVVTLVLSFLVLREPFTWRVALGATLIMGGLVVLVWK